MSLSFGGRNQNKSPNLGSKSSELLTNTGIYEELRGFSTKI